MANRVRCAQRKIVTAMALVFGPLISLGPVAGGVVLLLKAPAALAIPASLLLLAWAVFAGHQLSLTYDWVELDGTMIRGQKFWSRCLVERRIDDVIQIVPLQAVLRDAVENQVIDILWGTTNRGYEIRFREGTRVLLIRGDMIAVDEFMAELWERMSVRWNQVSA